MASTGCIFLCGACDRKICDETFSHKIRKGNAYVSGNYVLKFKHLLLVGFEALTAVSTKMAVFWFVAPGSLVEVYQRFRGPCCRHHQGQLHGAITQKTAIYVIEVRGPS
jgi:hypothetical protein